MSQRPRVVVTGIGVVTPIGTGVDDFWEGMTSGRNGVRPITQFPTEDLSVKVAGEVDGFDPSAYLETKEARRTDRYVQFALASASLAWADAAAPEIVSERGGCIFGTGIGGIQTLLTQHSVLLEKGPGQGVALHGPDAHGERRRRTHRDAIRTHGPQHGHALCVRVVEHRDR